MRAWLAALLLCAGAAQAQLQTVAVAKGSTRSSVGFTLPAIGESRLALQFDLPLTVTRITLVDPAGRAQDLALGSAVQVIDAASRQQRSLGNHYTLLRPLHNPAAGAWRIEIDHGRAQGGERLQLLPSQLPRFELRLGLVGGTQQRVGAGSERLVELRASDQGDAAQGLQPQGTALHADSGTRTALVFWHDRPAGDDLPVQAEPGQYFAYFAPGMPGRYTLQVQQQFSGSDGRPVPLQQQLDVTVAAQAVLQALRVEPAPAASGCVPRVDFAVDWQAQAPGRYALTVVLQGSARTQQFRGGATVAAAGSVRLQAGASARDLLALGDGVQALRVDVLHFSDAGFELVQRRRQLRFSEPLAADRLCR